MKKNSYSNTHQNSLQEFNLERIELRRIESLVEYFEVYMNNEWVVNL